MHDQNFWLSRIINTIEPYTVFDNNLESDFQKDKNVNHMFIEDKKMRWKIDQFLFLSST